MKTSLKKIIIKLLFFLYIWGSFLIFQCPSTLQFMHHCSNKIQPSLGSWYYHTDFLLLLAKFGTVSHLGMENLEQYTLVLVFNFQTDIRLCKVPESYDGGTIVYCNDQMSCERKLSIAVNTQCHDNSWNSSYSLHFTSSLVNCPCHVSLQSPPDLPFLYSADYILKTGFLKSSGVFENFHSILVHNNHNFSLHNKMIGSEGRYFLLHFCSCSS